MRASKRNMCVRFEFKILKLNLAWTQKKRHFNLKFVHSFMLLILTIQKYESRGSSVGIGLATSWTIGVRGFASRQWLGIFLFSTASRRALGPTQPPIQWVPRLSPGVKRQGREADNSPPPSAKVKNAWRYASTPPIRLHSWYLLSTRTTLPYNTEIQMHFKSALIVC
jgi:hypothetical protein